MALWQAVRGWLGSAPAAPAPRAGARWERRTGQRIRWRAPAAPREPGVNAGGDRAAGSGSLGWLVVRRSPDQGRRGQLLSLAAPATVLTRRGGRDRKGEQAGRVVFADEFMSGDHATVVRAGRGFQLVERQVGGPPANGLYVNGRRVLGGGAGVKLMDGDVLRLGATELVFKQLNLSASDERA